VSDTTKNHLRIAIEGLVQGVGFRPFIARLANRHRQNGWIANTSRGVSIAIEGTPEDQKQFLENLDRCKPAYTEIAAITVTSQPLKGYQDFQVKTSLTGGKPSSFVLPDIATCRDCLQDLFNPVSRYYRYPFTSCCHCGPRYSILTRQPYDRSNTGMAGFELCPTCKFEYEGHNSRRFHAQTIACPDCGPELQLMDDKGSVLTEHNTALVMAAEKIKAGHIIAVKGIGGFQLIADATSDAVVELLRKRKCRPEKPFALMARDLASIKKLCFVDKLEQEALLSPAAPIVLLKRCAKGASNLCNAIAPGITLLGIMLPSSPLHHLLLAEFDNPLIVTSGNRQDEPICIDANQALQCLTGIADYFLTHNRPVLRPLDDSIVRIINGKTTLLRRARGYSPLPITMHKPMPDAIAVGGQLKNSIAIASGHNMIVSQHLGDLDSAAAQRQFRDTIDDLVKIYQISPSLILHDLHKAFASSQFAEQMEGIKMPIQHHFAHALACMAEHGLEPPALGISWDGSGLGENESLWGGEFLLIHGKGYQRFAHFRPYPLPGGVKAIRESRRAALGLLFEIYAGKAFDKLNSAFTLNEINLLKGALTSRINCPLTTSAGRLFDAVASLIGLCQVSSYEGQAALLLENQAAAESSDQSYPFELKPGRPIVIDWQPLFENILGDLPKMTPSNIAAKFHNTLAEIMLAIAGRAKQDKIVLSGGCFQNAVLVEKTVSRLTSAGFKVFCHERIPPNDGGLALGQLYAANYLGI
jgi:hydrogenase maturation protein HypF